jgi:hypothetical protein
MAMWQRRERWNISWDFAVLGRVTRNSGRLTGLDPSGDRRVDDICLTLTTSNPRSTSPSEMSCAGVLLGRWRNTALMSNDFLIIFLVNCFKGITFLLSMAALKEPV